MATNVTLNGVVYAIPAEGDSGWGTILSNFFISIGANTFQKTAGNFTLTAEANFGANFGLKSLYLKSQAANPSASGSVRLGNDEAIGWRNAANSADLTLKVDSGNNLNFNGTSLSVGGTPVQTEITVTDSSTIDLTITDNDITAAIVAASIENSHVAADAAIDYSKLNLVGAILNADLAGSIAYSKLNLTGEILNADLAGSIAASKFVGSDIATVGTITTGTWSASTIALNKGGTGQTTKSAAFDALSPMSASGDIIYGGASGTGTRLAKGSDGQALVLASGVPSWGTVLTNPMDSDGQIIYGGASGAPTKLAAGTGGQVLESTGGAAPVWGDRGTPTGAVQMFAGSSAPTGWLLCDGSAVSRATYSVLFGIVGTTYGVGDGSTTFNLPDARGIFIRGAGSQTISSITYSGALGTKQGDQMQGHRHGLQGENASGGAGTRLSVDAFKGVAQPLSSSNAYVLDPITDGVNGTPRTGSETRPANISLNYIIKT